jgi:Baseplate J-like protein
MSPRITSPKIDPRKASDVLRALREMAPHYTKEWSAKDYDDPGVGLLKIFSSIAAGVIDRLNRAPDRNFLAFLDMLGIRLLQARPAHAPVHFIVADGTEFPFLVEKGTQVSAPPTGDRPVDLPFETLTKLLVVPSALTSLVAVDPELDQIYLPPPGFLDLSLAATELPELTVEAFSGAKSKTLQLEPPDQVKPGDFLRIDSAVKQISGPDQCVAVSDSEESIQSEHLVVADVKGSVVTVTDPLLRDYGEGTFVQRVTQFELFNAKNWQEHILYIAHAEYFSIKSEAQIDLTVRLASPGVNLQGLRVAWEYYGEIEATKEKTWLPLELDGDGTQGFARDGLVHLTKPEGEIKETEINGQKNRWIRARLDQPLPPLTSLPKVESVAFSVSHKGSALAPDKAFNNETPLTTAAAFFPFGNEPRIFDRFSISSKEAFSKPEAEITLDFTIDAAELLASADAIIFDNKIRAFARGVGGKLLEFTIDPREPRAAATTTVNHEPPDNTVLTAGSKPAVVHDGVAKILVFAKADDGHVHARSIFGTAAPVWHSLTLPPGSIDFDPAAVLSGSSWHVYVVAEGRLYSQTINTLIPLFGNTWTSERVRPTIDSSPFVLEDAANQILVFVTDTQKHVWRLTGTTWTDITATSSTPTSITPDAAENARPFAFNDPIAGTIVCFRSIDGDIIMVDSIGAFSLGKPATGAVSNPSVAGSIPVVYAVGDDRRLWSINIASGPWKSLGRPPATSLIGDPVALAFPDGAEELFSILSTSDKNSLLEFRRRGDDIDSGALQAGPLNIVALAEDFPVATQPDFILLYDSSGGIEAREIDKAKTDDQFVVTGDPAFPNAAKKGDQYELLDEIDSHNVVAATHNTLTLQTNTAQINDYVFVDGQTRQVDNVAGTKVTVVPDWDGSPPTNAMTYHLLRVRPPAATALPQIVSIDSIQLAVLAASATAFNLDRRFLLINSGAGKIGAGIQIAKSGGTPKHVELAEAFVLGPPKTGDLYKVVATQLPQAWFEYVDPAHEDVRPELSWEYGNGLGWLALDRTDNTEKLLHGGTVTFTLPSDVAEMEVGGQKGFWIRARLISGDYGHDIFKFDQTKQELIVIKNPISPPMITKLFISYALTEVKQPQLCLTFNNLSFVDQSAANATENKNYLSYVALKDQGKAVYFGFDREFSGGPVKMYFAAKELIVDERNQPKLVWSMAFENDWKGIIAEDETDGFTRPGFVTLDVPPGFQNTQRFGRALFWLRASLVEGAWDDSPLFSGVFPNTAETIQARTIREEILGSSTGLKNQKYEFQQTPVIEGEEVRVREALTDQEREQLVLTLGQDAVFTITDQQDRILETWIRWSEVIEFFDSDGNSRHYRLDRHTGEIEFGDGIHGRIPPVGGDNIRAFVYQAGGGASGNVKAGEINTPVTAVAGVDSVINPVAGGGGSDPATNEDMMTIGPAQISHRNRAVTPDDYERLAMEASREVRKARCLPNRNASGRHELGWTTVYIVPDSKSAEPTPSLELRRSVQRYLADRADLTLVSQKHIVIGPPEYVPVSIEAIVFAKTLDDVATADQKVKRMLESFLHPLNGGTDEEGWEFGRELAASDLYSLLEGINEVDHVESLKLIVNGEPKGEQVIVGPDALIASGTHKVTTLAVSGD